MGAEDVINESVAAKFMEAILGAQASMQKSDEDMAILLEGLLSKGQIGEHHLYNLPHGIASALDSRSAAFVAQESVGGDPNDNEATLAELEDAGGYGAEQNYPNFLGLAGVFRPSGIYGPIKHFVSGTSGEWTSEQEFTPYPGQVADLKIGPYMAYSADGPDALLARQARIMRQMQMWQSFDAETKEYIGQTRPTAPLGFSYGQAGAPTSFTNRYEREQRQFRNKKGQFDRKGQKLNPDEIDVIGKAMRDRLLERYDRLIGLGHGGEQTGALRKALEHSTWSATKNEDTVFEITLLTPDEPGEERERAGKEPRPSTGVYGKYVFFGRGPVQRHAFSFKGETSEEQTFLHFKLHGDYITSKDVLPSRTDLNIYEDTAETRAAIGNSVQAEFAEVLSGAL